MEIFPAIDLKNGQCVRLTQGDFERVKIYESDPVLQAMKFADAGATWLHVVDLDGARHSEMKQFDIIAKVANDTRLNIQVGGGIRDKNIIEKLLGAGIKRVVIGSLAVKNRPLVKKWLQQFGPERIVLAFDIRLTDHEPEILTHGWQSSSRQLLWDVLEDYDGSGVQTVLCTDVGRDGMLAGANHILYQAIKQHWPTLDVLASGGVSDIDDLMKLAELGVSGAIVGKAIYEGCIGLADAIKRAKNAG